MNWIKKFKRFFKEFFEPEVKVDAKPVLLWRDVMHFKPVEFESKDLPGSGMNMSLELIYKLDEMRTRLGFPIIVTSGFRTKKYNRKLKKQGYKASKDSAHLKGLAVDIRCQSSLRRYQLIDLSLGQGINRIGINGKTLFLHLDIDPSKPKNRIWVY